MSTTSAPLLNAVTAASVWDEVSTPSFWLDAPLRILLILLIAGVVNILARFLILSLIHI